MVARNGTDHGVADATNASDPTDGDEGAGWAEPIYDESPNVSLPFLASLVDATTVASPARSNAGTEVRPVPVQEPPSLEAELLAVLRAPARPGASVEAAFREKEAQLGAIFSTLSLGAARELLRRLSPAQAGDEVSAQFGRLTFERRKRLLDYLEDAPRRAAMGARR